MSEAVMKEAPTRHERFEALGPVLTGIIVGVLLTIVTDVMLHAIGVYPPSSQPTVNADALLLLATAYRVVYGVLGATSQRGSRLIVRCDTLWRRFMVCTVGEW
jgi:hypothetical protein